MAKRNLKRGLFISLEGPEGSGKSTQAKLLHQYLRKNGFNVNFIHEPGTTAVGKKIRSILLDPENKELKPLTEMLLYMTSRAQLIDEKIKPALDEKRIIICDRFLDSTLVYQGYGLGMDLKFIKNLGDIVCQGIEPSLTIMLDIQPAIGLRRSKKIKDRIERRSLGYHNKVRRGYLRIAKANRERVRLIPAESSVSHIHSQIIKLVNSLIKENS